MVDRAALGSAWSCACRDIGSARTPLRNVPAAWCTFCAGTPDCLDCSLQQRRHHLFITNVVLHTLTQGVIYVDGHPVKTMDNPHHMLHQLLPPQSTASQRYHLRHRTRDRQLPVHHGHLADCNFVSVSWSTDHQGPAVETATTVKVGTNLKVGGGHQSGAKVGRGATIRRQAQETIFLVIPLHFLALKVQ